MTADEYIMHVACESVCKHYAEQSEKNIDYEELILNHCENCLLRNAVDEIFCGYEKE